MRHSRSKTIGLALGACVLLAAAGAPARAAAQTINERALESVRAKAVKTPFDFIAIGDPQGNYEAATRLLEGASRHNPAFAIFLGDLTQKGKEEQYQSYAAMIAAAKMPVLSVIGNHDTDAPEGRATYERLFGSPDFSFEAGGRRFVVLDTAGGQLSDAQLAWFEKALEGQKRTYVFTHEPPYMGNWWFNGFVSGTGQFLSLIERARAPWVFIGHSHVLDGLKRGGTRFLMVGSGGIIPYTLPQGKAARCYVRVHVTETGEEMEVIGLQGERIEIEEFFN